MKNIKNKSLAFLLFFLIAFFNLEPGMAQFEIGDEYNSSFGGGTLWQGSLPTGSSSNPGRPGMFKLMWNSKVTKIDMIGKVQGNIGIAKGGAEVMKSYDFEKRTFSDATLKTNVSIGYGVAKAEIRTSGKLKDPMNSKVEGYVGVSKGGANAGLRTNFKGKVTAQAGVKAGPLKMGYREVISKPANDGSFKNIDGKKAHVASGTSLMDSLWGVFGKEWHTHVADNTNITFEDKVGDTSVKVKDAENYQIGGKIDGIGLKVGKSKGNETFWAGTGNAEVGYTRYKDDKTKISLRAMPFCFPNVKAGGGVNLYMVPMTPEEIKVRNQNLAKSYNNAYSSSMASNMGFVLENEW